MLIQADPTAITSPWRGHQAGTSGYRRMVLALMAGGLANFSLMYFVQPLLPLLATHYGVSPAESAHALSVTTLTIILGLLIAGPLSDRIGRVQVMRWSLVASGVLGLASAFAPSWQFLLLTRGLMGITLAGLPAAALAYLREEVEAGAHTRANAAYIAGTAVGGAAGRLLPGPLAAVGGWPLAAATLSGVTLCAGLALWLLLPVAHGFVPHHVGGRDALLGTLSAPRDPVIAWLCVGGFTAMGTFVGVYNAVGFRLQAAPFDLGTAASLIYLAYPVGILAPNLARQLSARVGRGTATAAGGALLAASVALISLPGLPEVFCGLGMITFAFLGTHSLLSGWVVDRAKRRGVGTAQASSAYLLTYYLGSTIAGAVATIGWQSSGWGGVEGLSIVLAGGTIVAALAASRVDQGSRATALSPVPHH